MRVAVNSSPLIFLAKLGLLHVLDGLFDEVYLPMQSTTKPLWKELRMRRPWI
ncbi:hypothetical protein [Thermococcus sp. AM4]|uniref:hypothetical protein n=1 Tax=Thermococcus sp. (strain AM4) TaxID=246969 RepID=UPI001391B601|nr:hypothetical protein [Thermococcus sp. AM4]